MLRCPVCRSKLIDHGFFLLGSHDLIVCKRCGCRLKTHVSWPCAIVIIFITLLFVPVWAYSPHHNLVLALFIVWVCCAPFIQERFTVLEKTEYKRKKLPANQQLSVD